MNDEYGSKEEIIPEKVIPLSNRMAKFLLVEK
jgi:hypothetical protein